MRRSTQCKSNLYAHIALQKSAVGVSRLIELELDPGAPLL